MTTTPTPVERAAALLHNLIALLPGVDHHRMREHAERVARAVVAAALDVDEIARVLAPDDWRMADDPRYAHLPDGARESLLRKSREQAAAVIAHLTGATR